MTYILPVGITGFYDANNSDRSKVELDDFYYWAAALLCAHGYEVECFNEGQGVPNFYWITFHRAGEKCTLVCNAIHPILALARQPVEGELTLEFCRNEAIEALVADSSDFSLWPADVLKMPFDNQDIAHLAKAEREQIKYWRPNNLGELMFNWWD